MQAADLAEEDAAAAGGAPAAVFKDPANMRILVIDSKAASRAQVCQLLRSCGYVDVHSVKTSREALQLVDAAAAAEDEGEDGGGFDLILKEHEPPSASACRLLKRLAKTEGFHRRGPPVVGE